jgi:iron complex transport system substrate-binding protein
MPTRPLLPALLCAACIAIIATTACRSTHTDQHLQGNYYTPRYARGFCIDTIDTIDTNGGSKVLTVVNPFQQSQQQYTYTLGAEPMQRVVCMSTTHLGFLDFIGKADAIVGVSAAKYIYNPALYAAYSAGKIAEVGYDANIDIERIAALQPDAVLAYGIYNEFEQAAQKLQALGISVIYIGEYVEPHPLGKAEWAVAIAALLGCEDSAMQRFAAVEQQYLALKQMLPANAAAVHCLLNSTWNDSWFMPCQQSNMATYLRDAGGTSVVPLRSNCEAFPESIESVYALSQDAECWLNAGNAGNASTLAALGGMHKLIAAMPVFASGRVYNHNKRTTQHGGSDFFESGAVSPHLVLKDLILILHPDLLPMDTLYYYQRVE